MKKLSLSASISTLIIIVATFCAIFCYIIVPDQSPSANLQIPEIALLKPGTKQFLFKEKILNDQNEGWVSHIVKGRQDPYKYHPVDSISKGKSSTTLHFGLAKRVIENKKGSTTISKTYWLGTDKYGRDIMSRLIVGLRVSLFVGIFAVVISVLIGTLLGVISGYFGSCVDKVVMTIVNVNWSIPTLLLAFAILLVMERGLMAIYLAIGLTLWVDLARILRGQVIELKSKEFILSAQTMGMSSWRIMWKHVVPNLYGTILVIASINFATAILVEAGLSYLGLGVQPPVPSLGNMLKENYGYATSGYVVLSIAPALIILVLVLSFNLLGNGLRDYYDIRRSVKSS